MTIYLQRSALIQPRTSLGKSDVSQLALLRRKAQKSERTEVVALVLADADAEVCRNVLREVRQRDVREGAVLIRGGRKPALEPYSSLQLYPLSF